MVLIVVLVVITMLALGALTFSELMLAEREGAEVSVVQSQARAAADSGVEVARLFLSQHDLTQKQEGGSYDNPSQFRGIAVTQEASSRGLSRFTIVSPRMEDGRINGIRSGLADESARLNLNTLKLDEASAETSRKILMGLPGMTEEIADAILDWMDPDDEPREFGAEIDSYAALSPAYATKNGPLETIEELLLVRGVTPSLLFGMDANRNFLVDATESGSGMVIQAENSDGAMNFGWTAYVTLYSAEGNAAPDGTAKINIKQATDLKKLSDDLGSLIGADWAKFIVAYRMSNGYVAPSPSMQTVSLSDYDLKLDQNSKAGSATLDTVLDLIATRDATTGKNKVLKVKVNNKDAALESPFLEGDESSFLPKLMDAVTVSAGKSVPGRININQASRVVLAGITNAVPDFGQEVIDQVVSKRPQDMTTADDQYRHETWLLTQGIVKLDVMKKLMPYVCAGGSVFRGQVIGYYDKGGPAARIEVVIDATTKPPRIVFWRDLTHLGRGYPLETLGVEAVGLP
jgi:type II secretory pathway component PulK